MICSIPWNEVDNIAELGSGTGAITKYIQEYKQTHTKVLLFEKERHLKKMLEIQYPNFKCYSDACQLNDIIRSEKIHQLDCILSGLPFFNFPQVIRDQLMNNILKSLKSNGIFIAFQYSKQMKNQFSIDFDIEEIHFVPLNFPPAFVFVCRKR
jgi:phospholipid N-methyltransferase